MRSRHFKTWMLAVLLCMPQIGGYDHVLWNGIYETSVVLFLFPLVVAAGAGSTVSGRSATIWKESCPLR